MTIRPAYASDAETIRRIIHDAGINPMSLDWHRFVIAEEENQVVGIGQIKPHGDGSRELASLAVIPERHGQGIGGEIIRHLLEKESGVIYLTCRAQLESYYTRFGFCKIGREEMTPYFQRIHRIGNIFARIAGTQLLVMRKN